MLAIVETIQTETAAGSNAPPAMPKIADIQDTVGTGKGLTRGDFKSKSRVRRIAHPRQVAMFLARDMTDCSFPKIGRDFGGRHHTTVLHAYRKILREARENPKLSQKLDDYRARIQRNAERRMAVESGALADLWDWKTMGARK